MSADNMLFYVINLPNLHSFPVNIYLFKIWKEERSSAKKWHLDFLKDMKNIIKNRFMIFKNVNGNLLHGNLLDLSENVAPNVS